MNDKGSVIQGRGDYDKNTEEKCMTDLHWSTKTFMKGGFPLRYGPGSEPTKEGTLPVVPLRQAKQTRGLNIC